MAPASNSLVSTAAASSSTSTVSFPPPALSNPPRSQYQLASWVPPSIMKRKSLFSLPSWSKIHPPLPRTPRESQQLLNALTSSFRRQLDHHHPAGDSAPSSASADPNAPVHRDPSNPDSSAHATDKHLRTILDNPLFRVAPTRPSVAPEDGHGVMSSFDLRMTKEPMVLFDELVASGSVTESSLRHCLNSQLLLLSHHTGPDFVKALRESRTASKVVSWWLASDSEAQKMLFQSRFAIVTTLLKFMVAEGLQRVVLLWLKGIVKGDIPGLTGHDARNCFAKLLVELLSTEAKYGGGLGSSIEYYVQASKEISPIGTEVDSTRWKAVIRRMGLKFASDIANETAATRAAQIPSALYDQYMETLSLLTRSPLSLAWVPMYHPTHPDASPFISFVATLSPEMINPWSQKKRQFFIRNGFDALRLLLDQEKGGEAADLARFMRHLLPAKPEDAPETTANYQTSAKEEDLLTRLGLGLG